MTIDEIEKKISFYVGLCSKILELNSSDWQWMLSGELQFADNVPACFLTPAATKELEEEIEELPTVIINEKAAFKDIETACFSVCHEIRHVWQYLKHHNKYAAELNAHVAPASKEYFLQTIERDAFAFELFMMSKLTNKTMPEIYIKFPGIEKDIEKMKSKYSLAIFLILGIS